MFGATGDQMGSRGCESGLESHAPLPLEEAEIRGAREGVVEAGEVGPLFLRGNLGLLCIVKNFVPVSPPWRRWEKEQY